MPVVIYPPATGGVAIGDTVTGATAGSVFFAGAAGILAQDNAGFFYNDATNLLLIKAAATTDAIRLEPLSGSHSPNLMFKETASNRTAGFRLTNQGAFHVYHVENGQTIQIGGRPETTSKLVVQGREDDSGGLAVQINTKSTTSVGLTVNLEAAQSADALQVKNSSSAVVAAITSTGAMDMLEQTAPSAPAANSVRLYAVDNGAGKTQLMALFATGVAQQVAIEP